MRLLNNDLSTRLENITVYLKKDEVVFLMGALENLIDDGKSGDHCHVNDLEYVHEITVTMYDENNLDDFDERSRKLIKEDK